MGQDTKESSAGQWWVEWFQRKKGGGAQREKEREGRVMIMVRVVYHNKLILVI